MKIKRRKLREKSNKDHPLCPFMSPSARHIFWDFCIQAIVGYTSSGQYKLAVGMQHSRFLLKQIFYQLEIMLTKIQ